jgi:hypothetical protein
LRVVLILAFAITTASGQTPEAVVLGGPCAAESGFPSELVKKHSAAERRGNRELQIQLAKEMSVTPAATTIGG